jgi:hypothetical protein
MVRSVGILVANSKPPMHFVRKGVVMNTYRTHTQLSAAIQSLARVRDELDSAATPWVAKPFCLCRWLYAKMRVRQLTERLHPH